MATIFYDRDSDIELIRRRKVAVLGYGSQGHAHALNLRDSGVDVRIGLRAGARSEAAARNEGLTIRSIPDAVAWADVVMVLLPDPVQGEVYAKEIEPALAPGTLLLFAHGFAIRFGAIRPPAHVDVAMVAPKSPGHRVRELYTEGGGTPALIAVHQDATGSAHALTLSYARALGLTRAGVLQTTFSEETETDLFGEQAVLCGGVSALVKAGFETLVEAGYQPEVAYFECLHELKLIVDLMYRGGLNFMRYSVSDTAEYGDYTAGPRVVTDATRQEMRRILAEVRDGTFARAWMNEHASGRPNFDAMRRADENHEIERVGLRLRALMPFLDAVEVSPDGRRVTQPASQESAGSLA